MRAQHAQRQALYMTGLVVVNHLVAAIHAARVAERGSSADGFRAQGGGGAWGSGVFPRPAFLLMACFFPRVILAVWMLSLPLAVAAEERICGTRWLEQHRASFPAVAPKVVGASQEVGPIEVGTQLPLLRAD